MKTGITWKSRKTWREKLENGQQPKIVKLPPGGWAKMGGRNICEPRDFKLNRRPARSRRE